MEIINKINILILMLALTQGKCESKNELNNEMDSKTSYIDNFDLKSLFSISSSKPGDIEPIKSFNIDKYLGKWYEIARLENSFEKGLTKVTAEYVRNQGNTIKVRNSGFSIAKNKTRISEGKAKFATSDTNLGHLKVSFWGPFYSTYVIFHLEGDSNNNDPYSLSIVCGSTKNYCWILSRTETIPNEKLEECKRILENNGFDPDKFVYSNNS